MVLLRGLLIAFCFLAQNASGQDGTIDEVFLPFRSTFSKIFQTQAEVIINIKENEVTTMYYDLFHDRENKRGRIDTYLDKDVASMYYFADTQQVVIFEGTVCKVTKHNEGGFFSNQMWGWLANSSVVGPAAILFRETTDIPKTDGTEEVRGIPCERFKGTDKKDSGITITYWFTESSWKSPSSSRLPLRVSAKGKSKSSGDIDIVVEFTSFKLITESNHAFTIPKGFGCAGLQIVSKEMPDVISQYSFEIESFTTLIPPAKGKSDVTFGKVWYSGLGKIFKVIGVDKGRSFTEIQDFNTGVNYHFDEFDTCTMGPITSFGIKKGAGIVTSLKNPDQFIDRDQDYYYVGETLERDIPCNVWEAVVMDGKFFNIPGDKIVTTMYFSKRTVELVSNGEKEPNVPIALHVAIYYMDQIMNLKINFFNFDEPLGNDFLDQMDISNCFSSENSQTQFTISFPASREEMEKLKSNHRKVDVGAALSVSVTAGVSRLRLPSIKVYYEPEKVLLHGKMLDIPPATAGFYLLNDGSLKPTKEVSVGKRNNNDCALECLTRSGTLCTAYTTCETDDQTSSYCYLSTKTGADGDWDPIIDNRRCKLYIKSVTDAKWSEPALETALKTLATAATEKKIQLTVSDDNDEETTVFSRDFDVSFQPTVGGSSEFEAVQSGVQLVSQDNSETTIDENMQLVSATECYKRCLMEPSMACASFSFCPNTGRCRLSSVYVSENNKEDVEMATSCTVYRKAALRFFEAYPGQTMKTKGLEVKETSVQGCAFACRNTHNFTCRGFDFCPDQNACVMSETHVINTEGITLETSTCSYYSLKYSAEFVNTGRVVVTNQAIRSLKNVDFEECAKECFEDYENCQSINYCPNFVDVGSLCVLNKKSYYDNDAETAVNESCAHYIMREMKAKPIEPSATPEDMQYFPFQNLISSDFETHVEFTQNGDTKIKQVVNEYHNIKKHIGRFETYLDQKHTTYYYTYQPFQMVEISDSENCLVETDLKKDYLMGRKLWGWNDFENKIFGPSAVLFRKTNGDPEFKGRSYQRGIACDSYVATDKMDTGVTITYYFTASSWHPSTDTQTRIPVRVTAMGKLGNDIHVDNIWDFTYVKGDSHSQTAYQIPRGLGCENFKSLDSPKPPNITRQFSFVSEFNYAASPKEEIVLTSKVWVDLNHKITKVNMVNDNKPFSEIIDFNSGISYHMDETGNCVIGSIHDSVAEKLSGDVIGEHFNPLKFWNGGEGYYYIGKTMAAFGLPKTGLNRGEESASLQAFALCFSRGLRDRYKMKTPPARPVRNPNAPYDVLALVKVRDIDCDVWETINISKADSKASEVRNVLTFYFSDPNTETISDGEKGMQVPIAFRKTTTVDKNVQKPEVTGYNFFGFDESSDRTFYKDTNIENCFPDISQRNVFGISIPVTEKDRISAEKHTSAFLFSAGTALESAAEISLLRLPVLQAFFEPDRIYVEGILLERPPAIKGFYNPSEFKPNMGDEKEITTSSEDECAVQCVSSEKSVCRGFTVCPTADIDKFSCYFSPDPKAPSKPISTSGCKFYLKSVAEETMNDVPLNVAIGNLKAKVLKKEIEIFFLNADNELTILVPETIETDVKLNTFDVSEKFNVMTKNSRHISGSTLKTTLDVQGNVYSARQCYARCLKETNMICSSFSFCSNNHECRLSSQYLKEANEKLTETATGCNIYNKQDIQFFDELKGQTSAGEPEKTYKDTQSAEDCAVACREEDEFQCRGFNYCKKDHVCALSKLHRFDLPPMSTSTDCTHFSLKFSSEFTMKGNTLVWPEKSLDIVSVTLEECAKNCYDSDTLTCSSFNFCPGNDEAKSSCQMSQTTVEQAGVKNVTNPTCSYYERNPNLDVPVKPTETVIDYGDGDSSSRVSNKSFNATLASLFFVGIVLGILGFLGYSYYRKKKAQSTDGVAIRYSRGD